MHPYGQRTYGKGAMQAFYELEDGSYLKLTVGHFFGPSGTVINHVGINPTVTTTSNPLYQAHYDTIKEQLTNSKELASLKNVPLNKTFTINFSKQLATTVDINAVQLIELGGNAVETTIKVSDQKLLITPKNSLAAGKEYMLIVQPTIKNSNGKAIKQGVHLHITTVAK